MSKFLKWTFDLNIHIITIVHQNKNDNHAKGHLGTFIYQKAEVVLSVEKNGNISKVEPSYCRDIDTPPISFSIDEDGLPYFVDYIPTNPLNGKQKTDPFNMEIEAHKNILREVFKDEVSLTRGDFLGNLKFTLGKYSLANGDSKCKEFLIHYKNLPLVVKEGKKTTYSLNF